MTFPWNTEILRQLKQESARTTHAWLFSGPRGLGKVDMALEYSAYLLSDTAGFASASHPDFHVLMPEHMADAEGGLLQRYAMRYYLTKTGSKPKSVISVDQVRLLNRTTATYGHGSHKVILITPAHRLNINAANALLKGLEEPPTNTVFILVSERPERLPATVRSRCSTVYFRVPSRRDALQWLSNEVGDGDDLALRLDIAGGAPLRAAELVESGFLAARERVINDIHGILDHTIDVVSASENWRNIELNQALEIIRGVLADLIRIRFQPIPPVLFNPDQLDWLQHAVKRLHLESVFNLMDRIGTYLQDVNSPLDKQLVLEDFLLQLKSAADGNGGRHQTS